jgi:ankyrin repeat protein
MVRTLANANVGLNITLEGAPTLALSGDVAHGLEGVYFREKNIKTVLHAACHAKQHDLIEHLLEKGADPNIISQTSLRLDAWRGRLITSHALQVRSTGSFVACTSTNPVSRLWKLYFLLKPGTTDAGIKVDVFEYGAALHYACTIPGNAALKLVKRLIEHGADPNLQGLFNYFFVG